MTHPALGQAWSDDFESYPLNSAIEGQGGWEGWDGINTTNTVLSDTQARSGSQSIYPDPLSAPAADTVRQFATATSGTWVLEAWVYFPFDFSAEFHFLVMNDYAHGGPYEYGSWLAVSGFIGVIDCHCGGFGAGTVPIPYDRWVEIRQVIDLDNDMAEIHFDGALLAQYPWTGGYNGNQAHSTASINAIEIKSYGMNVGAYVDDIRLYKQGAGIGTTYCDPAVANSTGLPGELVATGSTSIVDNDVTLTATGLPHGSFGAFLTSQMQDLVQNPGGSQGSLCLGGSIGRYVGVGQIMNSGASGEFSLVIDLTMIPQPTGFTAAVTGETWNFQSWYRDMNPTSTSNFTNAYSVSFH